MVPVWMIMFVIQKRKKEAKDDVKTILEVVRDTNQEYKSKEIVNTIVGKGKCTIKIS